MPDLHRDGLKEGIVKRQKKYFEDKDNKLLVCDFDGYTLPDNIENHTEEAIEYVIQKALPKEFHDVSYVAQWSSSSTLKNIETGEFVKEGFNCHIFFISDVVLSNTDIKKRLFHNHMEDRSKENKKQGVDGSMFSAVQICFISEKSDMDDTFIDILADVSKVLHISKSSDTVNVKLRTEAATKKSEQRISKLVAKKTGFKKMKNADSEIILEQLIKLGAVRSVNSNGTMNLYAGPESTGGSFVYESNPEFIYTNNEPFHVTKWCEKYWNASIMMPEDVRIANRNGKRDVSTRIYLEHSNGDIGALRGVLADTYKQFQSGSLIVITNPGVGKTVSIPNHFEKVIYAKNSNKSVRELYETLCEQYPDKKIQQVFNFKETFKEMFPLATIFEYDTKDVFGGKSVDWRETIDALPFGLDYQKAEDARIQHFTENDSFDYDVDVVVMTNHKLNILKHEHKKIFGGNDVYFDASERYVTLTEDVKKEKIKKWIHNALSKYHDEPVYKDYSLTNEWTIVVDDPTGAETGLFVNVDDEDVTKVEDYNDDVTAKNAAVDGVISDLDNDTFDYDMVVQHLSKSKKSIFDDFLVYDGLDYIKKPAYLSIVNKRLKTIYTCAELLQVDEVEVLLTDANIEYETLNLRELQKAENALVIPTTHMTNSENDGMLAIIKNCANRTFQKQAEYVADGVGGEWNHTNTKGVNSLKNSDITLKISRKHPNAITNRKTKFITENYDELVSSKEILELMGDMEQAVGRNSGWRNNGKASYIFIAESVWKAIKNHTIYEMNTEPFDPFGQFLADAVNDVDKWFNARGYSIDMFLADSGLNGKLDGKGYKRLIRTMKAVRNLKNCKRKTKVLNILNDKMIDVCLTIDALVLLDGGTYVTIEDLNIRCKHPIQVLNGLGVKTVRYGRNQEHKIVINKWQINQLKLLVEQFRAIEGNE